MDGSRRPAFRRPVLVWTAILVAVHLGACSTAEPATQATCPEFERLDLTGLDDGPFRLPLDTHGFVTGQADFQSSGWGAGGPGFHAAEDYHAPAGTPVYAMADGDLSFSGRMGGYGWLVIVDHTDVGLYSLYGHLSPSRWTPDPGPVAKGDLIGYLGDEWENGGSRESPMRPHLHLGVRVGERTEYPGRGEWRWMAGWIDACPSELGWLQPSGLIASQQVPAGGFVRPDGPALGDWLPEILFFGAYAIGAGWWIVLGFRRHKVAYPAVAAVVLVGLGWYLGTRGYVLHWFAYVMAGLAAAAALVILTRPKAKIDQPVA